MSCQWPFLLFFHVWLHLCVYLFFKVVLCFIGVLSLTPGQKNGNIQKEQKRAWFIFALQHIWLIAVYKSLRENNHFNLCINLVYMFCTIVCLWHKPQRKVWCFAVTFYLCLKIITWTHTWPNLTPTHPPIFLVRLKRMRLPAPSASALPHQQRNAYVQPQAALFCTRKQTKNLISRRGECLHVAKCFCAAYLPESWKTK